MSQRAAKKKAEHDRFFAECERERQEAAAERAREDARILEEAAIRVAADPWTPFARAVYPQFEAHIPLTLTEGKYQSPFLAMVKLIHRRGEWPADPHAQWAWVSTLKEYARLLGVTDPPGPA